MKVTKEKSVLKKIRNLSLLFLITAFVIIPQFLNNSSFSLRYTNNWEDLDIKELEIKEAKVVYHSISGQDYDHYEIIKYDKETLKEIIEINKFEKIKKFTVAYIIEKKFYEPLLDEYKEIFDNNFDYSITKKKGVYYLYKENYDYTGLLIIDYEAETMYVFEIQI